MWEHFAGGDAAQSRRKYLYYRRRFGNGFYVLDIRAKTLNGV